MLDVIQKYASVVNSEVNNWFKAGTINDFPENSGACVKYKDKQIAVFNFKQMDKWYACQNLCPHKMEMVLSLGLIGDKNGIPKVACPLHKKNFSLEDGAGLTDESLRIAVYPVKIEDGNVYIGFLD